MGGKKKPTIVLIGDWYIDENWLISPQELYYASAPGNVHYLSLHKSAKESVNNLCAAAAILKMLKSNLTLTLTDDSPEFLAFGVWNQDDHDLFRCVLCGKDTNLHLSPYTLSNFPKNKGRCEQCSKSLALCDYSNVLINLAKVKRDKKHSGINVSTNRVIRCFEGHGGAEPRQVQRLDWILPFKNENVDYEVISENVKSRNVKAILIIDHGAGVVNRNSITELINGVRNPKDIYWFVRTKIDNPGWMEVFKERHITLEMNVWDFRLAAHRKGARRWWYGHHLGRAGLELLGEMTNQHTYMHTERFEPDVADSRGAVVLLDENTVFGMTQFKTDDEREKNDHKSKGKGKEYLGISINHPPGPKEIFNFERTTVFCAALFAQRLKAVWRLRKTDRSRGVEGVSEDFGRECFSALKCAYNWSKKASEKWSEEKLSLYEEYGDALKGIDEAYKELYPSGKYGVGHKSLPWRGWEYENEWTCWNKSSQERGILEVPVEDGKTRNVLQLWRGEGVLSGYICVGGPKRSAINRLVSEIAKFKNSKNPSHSFSCLIQSPPGWGKSFLAKCLASHFDMEFLEFSIAQMSDNRDLMDCFAAIASTQSKTQERRTLIFIDEVNAQIEGHSVMALLLSPLWGGTFVKDRHTFLLKPGVWVFASTSSPEELKSDPEGKGSDFLSRLNGPIIDLDSPKHWTNAISEIKKKLKDKSNMEWEEYEKAIYEINEYKGFLSYEPDDLKTEQVYLMVKLLNDRWGPIRKVDGAVLQLFHDLLPINGLRSLEFFSSCFGEIQRGEVRRENVPKIKESAELRRHVVVPQRWLQKETGSEVFVEIETRIKQS